MHGRKSGRQTGTNAFLRGVLLTCAVVVGGLLIAWLAGQSLVHDEIRREVERRFAERYGEFRVTVQHARLYEGRGVAIGGLSVSRRGSKRPLAYVNEVFAECAVDVEALLSGRRPQTTRVYLSGVRLWGECQEDGSWDIARLWPLPEFGSSHPPVSVRDATLEVSDPRGGVRRVLNFRNVCLDAAPAPPAAGAAQGGTARAASPVRIRGRAEGDHFEGLAFQGWWDAARAAWNFRGRVDGLQWSAPLRAALPADLQQRLAAAAALQGRLDFAFSVSHGGGDETPRFQVQGALAAGQIRDRRLPFPLFDVRGQFTLDNERLALERGFARNGATTLTVQAERRGWQADAPMTVTGTTRQLELDHRFLDVLPPELQDDWQKYDPLGTIDVGFRLEFDGRKWRPELNVACVNVSFAYQGFPYRLERGRGTLRLGEDRLQIDLTAAAAGQDVAFLGEFQHPTRSPTGWLEFNCSQPIPIDDKLLAALIHPQARQVVQQLRPAGTFSARGRFERTDPQQPRLQRKVQVDLFGCSMQYERFPYPLGMIHGQLLWDDDGWTFRKLTARNDSAYVEGEGYWRVLPQGGSELVLNLVGTDVPLEDGLRDALRPGARALWNQLRPRGTIDHLTVDLRYASASQSLGIDVTAQKWRKRAKDEGRSITIQPTWFPYRLDEVAGSATYSNGRVQLRNISAIHDQTQIDVSGACGVGQDGSWTVQLPNVVADRIQLNRELRAALPKEMGRAVERMNFEGELSLRGSLAFSGTPAADELPSAAWDVILDVEDARLQCGFPLEHLHGEIRLAGSSSEGTFSSRGELNMDSMMYRDLQLTRVSGPLWIDPSGIVLGTEADAVAPGRAPQPLTAATIGGQLSADIRVGFEPDLPYRLQLRLDRGDLAEFAQEVELASQNIRGRANALLTLSGNRHGWPSWRGTGAIRLFEADIYEIPVMLALLKLLSIRQPDTTAFTSSEIDFRVQGEHVYLDRINFNGDAVSLKGSGEMDLERRINLKFYSLVGPGELNLPVVRAVVRQASRQLLLIHVTGSLDQPQLTRDPLPLLKETLEQIFPEAVGGEVLSSLPSLGLPPAAAARR